MGYKMFRVLLSSLEKYFYPEGLTLAAGLLRDCQGLFLVPSRLRLINVIA